MQTTMKIMLYSTYKITIQLTPRYVSLPSHCDNSCKLLNRSLRVYLCLNRMPCSSCCQVITTHKYMAEFSFLYVTFSLLLTHLVSKYMTHGTCWCRWVNIATIPSFNALLHQGEPKSTISIVTFQYHLQYLTTTDFLLISAEYLWMTCHWIIPLNDNLKKSWYLGNQYWYIVLLY